MTKKKKIVVITCASVGVALTLAIAVPFINFAGKSNAIKKDYSYLKTSIYNSKVEVSGIDLVEQHISCGYATIEMMSSYYGTKITEDELSTKNKGRITTSSSNGFLKELKKSLPEKEFVKHSYLDNDVFLKEIHISLASGNPVAIEWAAKYEDNWTLHYSLVSGLDIANNNVTILNPYGYIENITVDEFISRTSFEAYKPLPFFLSFGFAYGAFEKNTIFFAL